MTKHLVILGAGPAGSAAAWHAAQLGWDVTVLEQGEPGRDKTCGDGLTPRAMRQITRLGLAEKFSHRTKGLHLIGFGGSALCPWPDSFQPATGSAMRRRELDLLLARHAEQAGATVKFSTPATDLQVAANGTITAVYTDDTAIACDYVLFAEGVRSRLAGKMGRQWDKTAVHGLAARAYASTPNHQDQWIHSHLELSSPTGETLPGYGWIFPLADGTVNIGAGVLTAARYPAKINTKQLLQHYTSSLPDWFFGELEHVSSALLPMGGAVKNIAGPNWACLGDAAGLVNPLNGEGIDYALESAEAVIKLLNSGRVDLQKAWPELLFAEYGAAFSLARRAAALLTVPGLLQAAGPLALRGPLAQPVMNVAARLMGNLVTPEDHDVIAQCWRAAARLSLKFEQADVPLFGLSR